MIKVNLNEVAEKIGNKPWFPIDIASLNDQVVRMAYFKGEFNWHKHENEDELFFVYKGRITVQLKEENLVLNEGEMGVIQRQVEHCPKSEEGAYVVLFEPLNTESKGD